MKGRSFVFFLTFYSICALASSTSSTPFYDSKTNSRQGSSSALPGIIYNYVDFDFNSSSGTNFNRFRGHSNIVGVGSNQLKLVKDIQWGIFFYHIDTTNIAHLNLVPNPQTLFRSDTKNDTILVHLMKPLKKGFYIDGGFGYGFNQTTLNGTLYPVASPSLKAYSNYDFNNWLANATLFYQQQVKSFVISAFVQGLYTQSNINGFTQLFSGVLPPGNIAPLTTKITYAIENINIRYQSDSLISPFISAGLVQVVDFNQSRPALTAAVTGSLPQFALNQDGYRIGGGVGITHKKAAVKAEYRYYRATHTFHSDQFILNLTYLLD